MVFSSTIFLFLHLPITLILYFIPVPKYFNKRNGYKNLVLLVSSIVFYAWGEPTFVFIMLASIVINYFVGLVMEMNQNDVIRKSLVAFTVVFNISLLIIFKYLSFISQNIALLVKTSPVFSIALPIGISFFTFQMVSYIIDVYRKNAHAQKSVLNVGLYIALFPQLIAGPIVRYNTIERDILSREFELEDLNNGVKRFVYGLAKKVVIANNMALIADEIFTLNNRNIVLAWIGILAYTFQIYFDFSGYSDMAIGLGRIFGFKFSENFNYPYISRSVTEFWRRWHISLSTWFRDYVYFPLGGNRVSPSRHILNLFWSGHLREYGMVRIGHSCYGAGFSFVFYLLKSTLFYLNYLPKENTYQIYIQCFS